MAGNQALTVRGKGWIGGSRSYELMILFVLTVTDLILKRQRLLAKNLKSSSSSRQFGRGARTPMEASSRRA